MVMGDGSAWSWAAVRATAMAPVPHAKVSASTPRSYVLTAMAFSDNIFA